MALVLWGRRRAAFAVGLCLGAAALAQPSFLLAGGLAAAAALASPTRWGWPDRRAALLLLAGLAVLPAVTGIRNVAVSGEPVLISANGGINFFIGNNPDADGTFHLPPESGLLNRPEGLFTSARDIAERAGGGALSVAQVDRHWFQRGADFWIGEPGRALGLTARKALLALNDYEIPNHYDYDYFRDRAIALRFLPTLGWLLPLGGVGLALAWGRGRREWGGLFVALLLSVVFFFVTARYRLPLAVLLWPTAGLAVERMIAWRRRPTRLVAVLGAAALYAGLAFVPLVQEALAHSHMANVEGATLLQQGDLSGAEQAFQKALDANPNNPEALNNLGRALALQGKTLEATNRYRHALAVDPGQAETYFNLEDLYRKAGRLDEALEILDRLEQARGQRVSDVAGTLAYRRGVLTYAKGDTARALAYLEEAVTAQPDLAAAWLTLSVAYRKSGDPAKSLDAARRGANLVPNSVEGAMALAAALVGVGDRLGALGAYQHAQDLGNSDAGVRYEMGRLLTELGRDKDAEPYLLAANEGAPNPAALLALGALYERAGRVEDARTAYEALARLRAPQAAEARKRIQALGPARADGRRR
jgi:tetratricopeptide (TPR) repeat protein